MGRGRAPGKVILVGEHFVVHGAPSIAVPLAGRAVVVEALRQAGPWDADPSVAAHLRKLLPLLGERPDDLTISVRSDLPVGAGLGGSAALAVALVRALRDEDGDSDPDPESVRLAAHELEKVAHGTPSGVDDAVAAWACPVRFVRGEVPVPLVGLPQPRLWVGLTPQRTSTLEAVAGVGRRAQERPEWFAGLMAEAQSVSELTLAGMAAEDWAAVGGAMNDNHRLLQDVGVSTSALDGLVDTARAAGAWGAKLTGGGLGGAAIALAPAHVDLEAAWLDAGAAEVIAP